MGNEFENFKKMVELARNNDPDAQNDLGVYIMERGCHAIMLQNALFMCPLRSKSLVVILCFPFFKSDVHLQVPYN